MPADPLEILRRPFTPRRPRVEFAAALLRRLEEEVPVITDTNRLQGAAQIPQMVHIGVADADRAMRFFGALFDWQAERVEYEGHVRHYMVNTAVVTPVLTDERGEPFVRLGFTVTDARLAAERLGALGGRVEVSELADDGGGWVQGDDPQGIPLVLWRAGREYPHAPPTRVAHGELTYFAIREPDPARGAEFYAELLGWRFRAPDATGYHHVDDHVQPVAMGVGPGAGEISLTFRVDDLELAMANVRELGGQASVPQQLGPMVRSECVDDQGTPFAIAVIRPV